MPMHDWTRVEPTICHHFHQRWATAISDACTLGYSRPGIRPFKSSTRVA